MGSWKRWEVIKKIPKENPWVTYMKAKVFQKNNCINGIAVGAPGSGKSWAVLSMMSQIKPKFKIEGNWFFKASDFMRAITEYYRRNDYEPGKIWVLDEAGVDLNNMNFYDEINKGLNLFFQTARHRNYIFVATVPFISFISAGVRKLMTATFRAEGWKNNKTIIIPRVLQYNDEFDKFYKRRLIVETPNGSMPCNKVLVRRPPIHLVREYERLKNEFTGDLFELTSQKIEAYQDKQLAKFFKSDPTPGERKVLKCLKDGMNLHQIKDEVHINMSNVYRAFGNLQNKGYEFIPIKEGSTIVKYTVVDVREKLSKSLNKIKGDE
jgi:hypothetical protein